MEAATSARRSRTLQASSISRSIDRGEPGAPNERTGRKSRAGPSDVNLANAPTDLPDVRIFRILVKSARRKYFAFTEERIRCIAASSRPLQEGVSRSSRHVGAGCDGPSRIAGRAMQAADGEIAWSWRPDAGVKPASRRCRLKRPTRRDWRATEANKPGTPRRARISRKAIAQGMPVFRRTCGDLLACFLHLHARLRVRPSHPAFPAPSVFRRVVDARLGRATPRE
jgi:hypothetical protein